MKISRRQCIVLFAAGLSRSVFSPKALEREWRGIAAETDGTVGAAALHLTTGMFVSFNGAEKFPLASVCKLPIAMNILSIVDEDKLRLSDAIDIPPQAVWPGVSVIADRWPTVKRYTLDEMVSLMVARSDNTAVEMLWRNGGGASAMANRFRQWHIDGIRLDRSERECGLSSAGITRVPKWGRVDADASRGTDIEGAREHMPYSNACFHIRSARHCHSVGNAERLFAVPAFGI